MFWSDKKIEITNNQKDFESWKKHTHKKNVFVVISVTLNALKPGDKYICISELGITGSGNGLSPMRHQAIAWISDDLLSTGTLRTNFSEILLKIWRFSCTKIHLKMSSVKWRLFCLSLSVLNSSPPSAAYMCQWIGSALVQIMACRLFSTKPLSKPMLGYCQLDP